MFEHETTRRTVTGSCLVASLLALSLLAAPAQSATVYFTGYLVNVLVDSGTSVFSGSGGVFSGSITYGNSAADGIQTFSDIDEADWLFSGGSYGGVITDGVTSTPAVSAEVGIINDWVLGADEALTFSLALGSPVAPGTIVDTWSAFALTSGAFYDDQDFLHNGILFGIGLGALGSSLYSSLDYQNLPPDLNAVDGGLLFIEDADAAGNTRFLGLGRLTATAAVVPAPAAAWLFGSGLLGLVGIARRRRSDVAA